MRGDSAAGYGINGEGIWELRYINDQWYGTGWKNWGFLQFQSRKAGLEYMMTQFPDTDKVHGTDLGRPFTVVPGRFQADSLVTWMEKEIAR